MNDHYSLEELKRALRLTADGADVIEAIEETEHRQPRRLSPAERHQLAADAGIDTWEEWQGDR